MDGNGRWATTRGLPRVAGHRRGVEAVRRVVKAAPRLGIRMLTLFAFSADNWKRPGAEVDALMRLFGVFLLTERERLVRAGVRLSLIGRRDRLPVSVRAAATATESATAHGAHLHLRAGDRLLRPRRDPLGRRSTVSNGTRAGFTAPPRGRVRAGRGGAGRRSADPHRAASTAERFPAVGERVRRAALRPAAVARLRRRRPHRRGRTTSAAASDASARSARRAGHCAW